MSVIHYNVIQGRKVLKEEIVKIICCWAESNKHTAFRAKISSQPTRARYGNEASNALLLWRSHQTLTQTERGRDVSANTGGESHLIPDVAVVGLIVRHKLGCLSDHFRVTRVLPQSLHGDHNRFGHLVGHHLSHHRLHLYSLTVIVMLPRSPACPLLCNPQTLIANLPRSLIPVFLGDSSARFLGGKGF